MAIDYKIMSSVSSVQTVQSKTKKTQINLQYGFEQSPGVLPGVGKIIAGLLEKLHIQIIADLWWHLPNKMKVYKSLDKLTPECESQYITCKFQITSHQPGGAGKTPYKVVGSVGSNRMDLIFFKISHDYIQKVLPLDQERVISGKLDMFMGKYQMLHPERIGYASSIAQQDYLQPIYSLTQGLTQKKVQQCISLAIEKSKDLPEWIDAQLIKDRKWNSFHKSLIALHTQPQQEFNFQSPEYCRLAYDEMLSYQIGLQLLRKNRVQKAGRSLEFTQELQNKLMESLPFALTGDQCQATEQINKDLKAPISMLRLLQGDVGSGKTIVAFMTLLAAVESGQQGAFLVPTEVLAKQHFKTALKLLEPLGVKVGCITGKDKQKDIKHTRKLIKNGEIQVVVGTHSLIQEQTEFANLGVVVIDEQHRFGVRQRLQIINKGDNIDVLLMSATPIPRTLLMAAYGDLDITLLKEKPAGRQPIQTKLIANNRIEDVIDALKRAVADDKKVYWVCSLIEDSESLGDVTSVKKRMEELQEHISAQHIGMIHSKMSSEEKLEVMEQFISGDILILVATTVIEVGVDVQDANIIIIEDAHRYGLSQLHQLRGRVGRNDKQAVCLLLYDNENDNSTAHTRLKVMCDSNDGFFIAEEDLRIRGGGDIMGIKQSGMPSFLVANLLLHRELMMQANNDAKILIQHDPKLLSPRGRSIRVLLKSFKSEFMIDDFQNI